VGGLVAGWKTKGEGEGGREGEREGGGKEGKEMDAAY
jgi:hypothetical protein